MSTLSPLDITAKTGATTTKSPLKWIIVVNTWRPQTNVTVARIVLSWHAPQICAPTPNRRTLNTPRAAPVPAAPIAHGRVITTTTLMAAHHVPRVHPAVLPVSTSLEAARRDLTRLRAAIRRARRAQMLQLVSTGRMVAPKLTAQIQQMACTGQGMVGPVRQGVPKLHVLPNRLKQNTQAMGELPTHVHGSITKVSHVDLMALIAISTTTMVSAQILKVWMMHAHQHPSPRARAAIVSLEVWAIVV